MLDYYNRPFIIATHPAIPDQYRSRFRPVNIFFFFFFMGRLCDDICTRLNVDYEQHCGRIDTKRTGVVYKIVRFI